MNPLFAASKVRFLGGFLAIGLSAAAAGGQTPASAAPAPQSAQAAKPHADTEWLAKTAALYYSSAKAGLTGFDCAVHPDWHALFVSANKGETIAEDDPRIVLLKSVKISIHAHMMGNSTIEWVADSSPDKPLDDSSTALLDGMHQSVEQTLEGFLQFWSPFMEVSVVPNSAEGLEITHTPTVHTIHAKEGDTEMTEVFSNELVLEQFNVNMKGTAIKFSPTYNATPQGLLVSKFAAQILPAGAPPEQAQVMNVSVDYQTVNGLTIPSHLSMNVIGTGIFDFTFDGCSTNAK
jgi:hypothetical protein